VADRLHAAPEKEADAGVVSIYPEYREKAW
jgi:hypothetical protein